MKAKDYMNSIRSVLETKLIDPNSVYAGKQGHERLARETGYALNGFSEKEQKEIIHSSYSTIYVNKCYLRPLLDVKEWINILCSQKVHKSKFD